MEFVVAVCDVRCSAVDLDNPPNYRCYVNDELFTERTWIWNNAYLEESIQIEAEPGKYYIKYELVNASNVEINYSNLRIEHGPAVISPKGAVHIYRSKNETT